MNERARHSADSVRGRTQQYAPRRVSAFTLLEVLICVILIALLAAMAWPAMQNQIKASELPESADRIRSLLFMARSEAVMEHRRFRVRFEPEQQQPVVEWEPDPIQYPGQFQAATSPWAREPFLLADVQVHEVVLDRPVWTKPLSETSNPDALKDEEEKKQQKSEDVRREEQLFLRGVRKSEDSKADEHRPTIVFNVDGSTEWATFVVARVLPSQELEKDAMQLWVVLDGRTGLAFIHEQVTDEQLGDPEFYVKREKLQLPDDVNVEDLTLEVTNDQGKQEEAAQDESVAGMDQNAQNELTQGISDAVQQAGDANGGQPAAKPEEKPAATNDATPKDTEEKPTADTGAGEKKPESKVDDSTLSEQEKQNMKKWLKGGGK